jgi:hypothetical protein
VQWLDADTAKRLRHAHICLLPTPYTLNVYTLHPTPYTLHPTPYTLHPTPGTRHPAPGTLRWAT